MKNIKEYVDSLTNLNESLLDDIEAQLKDGDKFAEE